MEKVTMRLLLSLLVFLSAFTFAQPGNKTTTATIAGGKIYRGIEDPNGGCGCASTDPASPCTGTSITQTFSPNVFNWAFSCSGGNCQCGRYITGDYWVKHPSGGNVVISSVTPAGSENGLMIDPTTKFATGSQGLLGGGEFYSAALNQMLALPISVVPGKTLVKAKRCTLGVDCTNTTGFPSTCDGNYGAEAYSMLTVVNAVPNDGANGRNTFRPPYVAGSKPSYALSDFNFALLPNYSSITVTQADLNAMSRWAAPYPDTMAEELGGCFVPGAYPGKYSATVGQAIQQDILLLLGNKSGLNATTARQAIVQRGLDVYYSWQAGNAWNGNAGQALGRYPPIVYMAALSNNNTIKNTVRAVSAVKQAAPFQEIGQISTTTNSSNVVIWGAGADGFYDDTGENVWPGVMARQYWAGLFASKCYDGANGGNPAASCLDADAKGAVGDPYGYIDGPSGLPSSQYAQCCSGGQHIGNATIMVAWEQYCTTANDQDPIDYSNKMAYPSLTTAPGMVLNADPCAPPDPNESPSCNGYNGTGCTHFGGRSGATDGNSTWGPLPSNPAQCIQNNSNGNTGQTGRFSWLNGQRFMGFNTSAGSISYNSTPGYFPSIARNQYASLRGTTSKCSNGVWTP